MLQSTLRQLRQLENRFSIAGIYYCIVLCLSVARHLVLEIGVFRSLISGLSCLPFFGSYCFSHVVSCFMLSYSMFSTQFLLLS
jgi:hypothetical protein